MGYAAKVVTDKSRSTEADTKKARRVVVPDSAAKFFRDAFTRAREQKRPVVVDFWASWCGPCIRLKKETFGNEKVKKLLADVEVVFVDLDEHPELGETYGIDSIPDVWMISRDGFIVDRLHNFEPPAAFAERLKRLELRK